jgi:hypothetical protein
MMHISIHLYKRIEIIAEEKERKNARDIAVKLARVETLQLVQQLISLGYFSLLMPYWLVYV